MAVTAPEEDPLAHEIHVLGHLLGDVLKEREGARGFALVEEYRSRTKALRASGEPAEDAMRALLERTARLSLDEARLLVRAFTAYFHLVNLAEERHRMRVLRQRDLEGGDRPRGESVAEAVAAAARAGVDAARVRELLASWRVEPVFTAHPTEARRRTVLNKLDRLGRLVVGLDDTARSRRGARALTERIREEITALWLTDEVHGRAPAVFDEVRNGLYYFERSLWEAVPRLYRELEEALAEAWPGEEFAVAPFLRFGTWIGGDRDGNPYVTAAVTRRTALLQKDLALALYERDLEELQRHLSVAGEACVDDAFRLAL